MLEIAQWWLVLMVRFCQQLSSTLTQKRELVILIAISLQLFQQKHLLQLFNTIT